MVWYNPARRMLDFLYRRYRGILFSKFNVHPVVPVAVSILFSGRDTKSGFLPTFWVLSRVLRHFNMDIKQT